MSTFFQVGWIKNALFYNISSTHHGLSRLPGELFVVKVPAGLA